MKSYDSFGEPKKENTNHVGLCVVCRFVCKLTVKLHPS